MGAVLGSLVRVLEIHLRFDHHASFHLTRPGKASGIQLTSMPTRDVATGPDTSPKQKRGVYLQKLHPTKRLAITTQKKACKKHTTLGIRK